MRSELEYYIQFQAPHFEELGGYLEGVQWRETRKMRVLGNIILYVKLEEFALFSLQEQWLKEYSHL